jgi:hypothetical protein
MNIEDLTIKQARELAAMFGGGHQSTHCGLNSMIGQYVIVRTYSAGVHAGILSQKSGDEVILTESRRMWQWKAKESISLSPCATVGIDPLGSKIAPPVPEQWLVAVEIIPCSPTARSSIAEAAHAKAL